MTDSPILAERVGNEDGILWITLNRPEKMNALTFPLLHEMREKDAELGVATMCIGLGQGVATVVERT